MPEQPAIGIFWFALDGNRAAIMLAARCLLAEAEMYGDCLTFAPGHDEIWANWRRNGPPNPALAEVVLYDEYDEWPRGRIVFDRPANRFMLYADRRITGAGLVSQIVGHFRLPPGRVVVRHDQHYRSPRSLEVKP